MRPSFLCDLVREGKTSWDTFSYILQMVHNVWIHTESVQRANRMYDQGLCPKMLQHTNIGDVNWRNLVDSVFEAKSLNAAYDIIEHHENKSLYTQIRGVRKGTSGSSIHSDRAAARKFYGGNL